MVPTLDKEELKDRIVQAAKPEATPNRILRKKFVGGESSVERRIKNKIGRYMKSKIAPKTGVEKCL